MILSFSNYDRFTWGIYLVTELGHVLPPERGPGEVLIPRSLRWGTRGPMIEKGERPLQLHPH
jgi:hypothetical protein